MIANEVEKDFTVIFRETFDSDDLGFKPEKLDLITICQSAISTLKIHELSTLDPAAHDRLAKNLYIDHRIQPYYSRKIPAIVRTLYISLTSILPKRPKIKNNLILLAV